MSPETYCSWHGRVRWQYIPESLSQAQRAQHDGAMHGVPCSQSCMDVSSSWLPNLAYAKDQGDHCYGNQLSECEIDNTATSAVRTLASSLQPGKWVSVSAGNAVGHAFADHGMDVWH